jgi:hypothetical protein
MMVPARKASTLEAVEPELSLEVLVGTLGAPRLHDHADELLLGQTRGE